MMKKNLIDKPENVFVVLALIFGLTFIIVNPPFGGLDEPSHFYKAFDVSQGHLIPKNNVMQLPTNVLHIQEFSNHEVTNFSKISFYLSQPLNINETSNVDISNIAIYPPLPYLASGFVIFLGGLFDFSPLFSMYFGRLINLLVYIILVYFAIKIIPIYKYVLFLVALMPMALYQAGSLSADSLNLALSFLTMSFFLFLTLVKDKISNKDILISLFLVLALVFSKQGYALLILLFFIIPKEKFTNNIKRMVSFLTILLFPLISLIVWNLLFKSMYHSFRSQPVSQEHNIHFILSDPLNFPTILINTLVHTFSYYITSFVGYFREGFVSLPLYLIFLYCIVLVIVSLLDNSKYKLSFRQKIIPLFIFSVVSLSVFLFEFITYTCNGSDIIEGVQGRYFIPVIPLFLLLFYNNKLSNYLLTKIKFRRRAYYIYLCFVIFSLVISSFVIYYAI